MGNVPTRQISLLTFAGAVFAFLLPFVTFSCENHPLVNLTGKDLVTGTTVRYETPFGGTKEDKIPAEPLALVAAIVAILGVVASLNPDVPPLVIRAGVGAVGAVVLLLLKSKIEGDAMRQAHGLVGCEFRGGFWIALILLGAAAVVNALPLLLERMAAQPSVSSGTSGS